MRGFEINRNSEQTIVNNKKDTNFENIFNMKQQNLMNEIDENKRINKKLGKRIFKYQKAKYYYFLEK